MWRTNYDLTPSYAVKLVPPESEEVDIYEELHQLDPASPNHTLPCDISESAKSMRAGAYLEYHRIP